MPGRFFSLIACCIFLYAFNSDGKKLLAPASAELLAMYSILTAIELFATFLFGYLTIKSE